MNKILLIGKTSQLGAEIIKDANNFGFEIIGFKKDELDITNESQIKEKIKEVKPDILINTSAFHVLSKCDDYPLSALNINFIAVRNLAKICKDNKIKFVTYSTDSVFDGQKRTPYIETDLPNPLQIYGLSKLAGEYAALNSNPDSIVIRTSGLYGGKFGSIQKNGNFVLNIIKQAQGKNEIEISSEQIVSTTYAGDLSKATLKLLSYNAKPGIYHLTNNGYFGWHEFAKEIFKLAKINTQIIPVNRGGTYNSVKKPLFSALKNTKAKIIGIEMPSWKDGLKSYFDNEISELIKNK